MLVAIEREAEIALPRQLGGQPTERDRVRGDVGRVQRARRAVGRHQDHVADADLALGGHASRLAAADSAYVVREADEEEQQHQCDAQQPWQQRGKQ